MALDYHLHLATSTSSKQALERLASHVDGLTWSEDNACLFDETVTITPTETRALTRSIIEEAFHFVPTLRVGFRFVNNTDHDRAGQIMLQATMLLLEHAQDAVLLFNGEIIVLHRLGGKLVFNSEHEIWDDDWLKSRLTLPFERRPLPSPLL
jgi:hypothetical protein